MKFLKNKKQVFTVVTSIVCSVFLVAVAAFAATTIGNDVLVGGDTTLGDAVADTAIVKGRIATGTAAGAALTLDNTYTHESGSYLRYNVTDWTGIGGSLDGLFLRAETTSAASATKDLTGLDVYATATNVTTRNLKGILSYAYLKGTSAKTVNTAYGIHGELTFDASSGINTITTEAAPGLLKITGGLATGSYTKIQGLIIRAGDMDGADRTYGNAILVEDDTGMTGTITWTRGLKLDAPSTADIELQNGATITNSKIGQIDIAGLEAATVAGSDGFSVTTTQVDGTGLTGTLRGVYIQAINGTTNATGVIEGINVKAKASLTSGSVAVLTGASLDADAKGQSVTTMRAAELILDGSKVGGINEAVGLRIANNLQGAAVATTLYGIQIYADSQAYTADIQLSGGANVTNKPMIMSGAGVPDNGRCVATNIGSIYLRSDGADGSPDTYWYVCSAAGTWRAVEID